MTKISNSIKVKFGKKLYEKLKKKYLLFTKSLTLYNSADVFHQDCDGMVWSDLYKIIIHVTPGPSWQLPKKRPHTSNGGWPFTQGTGVLVLLAMYGYIVDLLFLALSPIDWN